MDYQEYHCEKCGSNAVEVKAWVAINTQTIVSMPEELESDDCWCPVCQEHNEITLKDK